MVVVQKHLCVTSNYVARQRAHGAVQKMTPVSKALRACPDLVQIDGSDLTPFRAANAEVMSVVRSFLTSRISNVCEILGKETFDLPCQRQGLDEIFIDVTLLVANEITVGGRPWHFVGHVFGSTEDDEERRALMVASQIAADLRQAIKSATQLTLCAGISDRKLLSKLSVDMHKPDDQTTFLPGNAREYVSGLPPRHLPGIGHAIENKIQTWVKQDPGRQEITTANDIVQCFGGGNEGLEKLSAIVGLEATAKNILTLCQGQDKSPVIESGDAPKSMTSMDSFRSCTMMDDVRDRVRQRATDLVTRLRRDAQLFGRRPKTLTIGYRFRGGGYTGTMRTAVMPTEVASLCSSKGESAIDASINGIQAATLRVLEQHGNVSASSKFDLTLLSISVTNFMGLSSTSNEAAHSPAHMNISSFFKKEPSEPSVPAYLKKTKKITKSEEQFLTDQIPFLKPKVTSTCPICDCRLPLSVVQASHHVDICLRRGENTKMRRSKKTASNTRRVDSFFRKQ